MNSLQNENEIFDLSINANKLNATECIVDEDGNEVDTHVN